MSLATLDPTELAIVLIDVQPYFLARMHGNEEPLLARLEQLLIVAEWFALPVLATLEEPLDRKGSLPERLQNVFPATGRVFAKRAYGLCDEPEIDAELSRMGRNQFAIAGGETDVCVTASVLGLLTRSWDVFLLQDCLFSSEPATGPALARLHNAGAVPCTYKTLFYELCATDDPARWESQHEAARQRGFVEPESLPPRSV